MPSGPIENQNGVGARGDMAGDLIEMKLHGFGIGIRQRQRGTNSASRTDGAKEIGILIALVGWLAGPRPAPGPLADDAVLLTDTGFVLEPDFDWRFLREISEMGIQRAREVFLNVAMVSASCAGCRGRALMWEKPSFCRSVPTYRSW